MARSPQEQITAKLRKIYIEASVMLTTDRVLEDVLSRQVAENDAQKKLLEDCQARIKAMEKVVKAMHEYGIEKLDL